VLHTFLMIVMRCWCELWWF